MKNSILIALSFIFMGLAANAQSMDNHLKHVVSFKFKETSSQQDIDKVVNAFRNLPNEIPQIKALEWGVNNSPENLNQGMTHCFTLTFLSEKDRDDYLPHPAHKAFGKILGPHLEKVFVIDYWAHK